MGVAQQVSEGFFDLFPHRVAVVMVDFQNDFCSPEVFGGGPVTNTRNAEAAQRASTFAAHAAGLGAHVVYTQQILDMGHLTARQRRWERPEGLCAAGTWGAGLFVEPVRGSSVVVKYRYDCWQSPSFTGFLDGKDIDGLVICGVELICCVLYAVLGAAERGYHYMVPQDLVSGQDPGNETGDKAVRDYLRFGHPQHAIESSEEILSRWRARTEVFPRGGLSADTGAVSERLRVREIDDDEGQRLVRIVRPGHRVGGDLAAGADGAAVRAGHGRGRDREGGVHQRGPGPRCDPQLQRRRVQLALPEVQRRSSAEVHASPAAGDQEDREIEAGRA
jgi:nicotinamidase-related amidase